MTQIPPIPDKEYFSIGEVSQITLVPKHTLRYWESEFNLLRPVRKSSGRRKYRKEDVELVFKIKDLLYNQKYSIEGAKKYLIGDKRKKRKDTQDTLELNLERIPDSEFLQNIKDELKYILKLLKK
ncbi:MerR family transcriptional regulator [Candidatus Endomicrobiellum devescovinae]|jgi:DNA-binding transcriptional MerR regulator|uniref:MerR family transcriptional regulator n=1 Tax=Candidatus Endomicrobiellum devescovinae TaxID=3242322 RepID=UPI00282D42C2|nr:MerR family transcriptional regulator [Endomicrobium sp.]MDR2818242.1 MerR family transcriptional regulator [Endomicrobium sp.]